MSWFLIIISISLIKSCQFLFKVQVVALINTFLSVHSFLVIARFEDNKRVL